MNEKNIENPAAEERETERLEFSLTDFKLNLVSSAEMLKGEARTLPENELRFAAAGEEEEEETKAEETSGVFKELAEPKLPALPSENRARLQMQSPNRIFFYWSLKNNPFQALQKLFGSSRSRDFTFVVKLINLTSQTENFYSVPVAGSWWFDVESDSTYRAEIGFLSADRPFVRLLFSNTVETPRSAPSPYLDLSPQFAVGAQEFAEVLDASGYKQDAFEMALAGDEADEADAATEETLLRLIGKRKLGAQANELRHVLFALAAGTTLADLRGQISPNLFSQMEKLMRENAERLSAEKVLSALQENFDFEATVEETAEEAGEVSYKTFGASLVNFHKSPRSLTKRFPKFSPVSSSKVAESYG
ncbi:MAG TPA: DUF4912 domain-containing protein [Pyrinomonadaceae bacterium]|nr:DUF4912 domain-containing protein [Pyrinomonadaceae bacterium]